MPRFKATWWGGRRHPTIPVGTPRYSFYLHSVPGFDAWFDAHPEVPDEIVELVGVTHVLMERGYVMQEWEDSRWEWHVRQTIEDKADNERRIIEEKAAKEAEALAKKNRPLTYEPLSKADLEDDLAPIDQVFYDEETGGPQE